MDTVDIRVVTAVPGARYGDGFEPAVRSDLVDLQLAHRSVRLFTADDVSPAQVRVLVAAAQSAPTSSNLQAWSVVAVRDPGRKARLAALAGGQGFVEQAPVLLVWVADLARGCPRADAADRGEWGR